jgi:hypothetical protein
MNKVKSFITYFKNCCLIVLGTAIGWLSILSLISPNLADKIGSFIISALIWLILLSVIALPLGFILILFLGFLAPR